MHPFLFELGPFKVHSYGLFMALALLISLWLIEAEAKKRKINPAGITNLCLLSFIFGLFGARIMYVLANMSSYREQPLEIIMVHHGGLMFHGGFFAGLLAAGLYLKKTKLSAYPVLDILAQYLPLGQAIGRIGCLLNGCCFGRESLLPWAIHLSSEDITRHPTQIYESIGNLFIFVVLRFFSRRPSLPGGKIFSFYLMLYSLNRILVEYFRDDLPKIWFNLSLTQWLSLLIFICGIKLYFAKKQ